jgi:hypothetical protein
MEPVRRGTRTGPVPNPKSCLQFFMSTEPAGFTGLPSESFFPWEPVWERFGNPAPETIVAGQLVHDRINLFFDVQLTTRPEETLLHIHSIVRSTKLMHHSYVLVLCLIHHKQLVEMAELV